MSVTGSYSQDKVKSYSQVDVETRYCAREKIVTIPENIREQSLNLKSFILKNKDESIYIQQAVGALRTKYQGNLEGKVYALSLRLVSSLNKTLAWASFPSIFCRKKEGLEDKTKPMPHTLLAGPASKAQSLKNNLNGIFLKYLVLDQIGKGTFNEVFYGYDIINGRPIAFRTLIDPDLQTEKLKNDCIKELLQQSTFDQIKNMLEVLAIIRFNSNNPKAYPSIVGSVHPYLNSTLNKCEKEDLLPAFIDVLEGIEELHKSGKFHGDLKPINILFDTRSKEIRICDFSRTADFNKLKYGVEGGTVDYEMPESYYCDPKMDVKDLAEAIDTAALGLSFYEIKYGLDERFQAIINFGDEYFIPHRIAFVGDQEKCWKYINAFNVDDNSSTPKQLHERMDSHVDFTIKPAYKKILDPMIDALSQSQDRVDKVIAKMINVDPVQRIKLSEALQELKKIKTT